MAQQAITTTSVKRAAGELEKMKSSLRGWLKYREINDGVLAGTAKTKVPPGIAKKLVETNRDPNVEAELATRLHALLSELMPGTSLPQPTTPGAAVQLAKIALAGGQAPTAMGGFFTSPASHPWLWPVLIVGGLLLAVTTAVKTAADVAKEREHYACIQSGACTDYGFWLKAGGLAVLGWLAWEKLGVGNAVKRAIKK